MTKKLNFHEKIMPICLALFFARTVFIGYKYLFFLSLVLCLVYSACLFFKKELRGPKFAMLVLPALVIFLYLFHFSQYSTVLKETANMLLVLYFLFFSNVLLSEQAQIRFFKWLVYLVSMAGVIAILRAGALAVGVIPLMNNMLFEGDGFSLVNDANFYSLFFILSILFSVWLLRGGWLSPKKVVIFNMISVVNVAATLSRRAYALCVILVVALTVLAYFKRAEYSRVLLYSVIPLLFFVFIVVVVYVFSLEFYTPDMSHAQKSRFHKVYLFINNNVSYREYDTWQQRKYYENRVSADSTNIFYDGDLHNGIVAWGTLRSLHDCINARLVVDEKGDNVIRVSRGCSSGYWQVHYRGRPIVYHKDVTYKISFVYRVLEGSINPFFVGWWVNEGQGWCHNLPRTTESIDSIWSRCTVSYKFKEDHINPDCFLNNLQAGSTIEVKDIRMTCDDTTGLPRYVDQLPDSVIHKYFSQDTINYFTSSRTDRWRYALELWQTRYNTKQKIFGQGFKYLEWYGEKFWNNPKRYDFPHNPIISSFLYSGIIGGVVYIIFLIMSFWLYWKKRQQLGIFFIMYLCCMFFCMFSGSSHFSFPLFAFLSFLPFVEYKNVIEKKENIVCAESI